MRLNFLESESEEEDGAETKRRTLTSWVSQRKPLNPKVVDIHF
jgi:hypothetical protein